MNGVFRIDLAADSFFVWGIRVMVVCYRKRPNQITGLAGWIVFATGFVNLVTVACCVSDEPPAAREFAEYVSRLRADSESVQGAFRVYRLDEIKPAAIQDGPEKAGIPLVRSGSLWRSPERFRVNFIRYRQNGSETIENSHAYAFDSQKLYEFSVGFDPDAGSLRIFNPASPGAPVLMQSINVMLWPLDVLWSNGGVGFDELVQRPEVSIVSGTDVALTIQFKKGGDNGTLDFSEARNHPLIRSVALSQSGDLELRMERHVDFVEVGPATYPSRIVDVCSFGPGQGGYTEIVELDLKPLEIDSPVARDFSADSFRDLGFGYNVARFEQSEIPTLRERFQRPTQAKILSSTRKLVLWINGFVIIAIIAAVIHHRYRRRNTRQIS